MKSLSPTQGLIRPFQPDTRSFMTGFEPYRLLPLPDHLHFPRSCDGYFARLLSGISGESEINAWQADTDREHVIHGLEWHRIGPVLYQRCKDLGSLAAQPSWLREYLKQSHLQTSARNLAIESELVAILQSLH